jgi:hypothetical protein
VSQAAAWRLYVARRRRELHGDYPCAAPTKRAVCPKHHTRVGPVTGLCGACRAEIYNRLAAEYVPTQKEDIAMNDTDNETIIAEPQGELELYDPTVPTTLFRTSDPDVALARMAAVAKTLVDVVEDRKLYALIQGRKHLLVSAWTTLASMLGLFPVVAWTRPNETNDGYLARVEVRTRDGELVGAAEAECSRAERTWAKREPFSLRAMAQTRATSRALRGPLEQIVILAEYEPAAAEEMPPEPPAAEPEQGEFMPEARPTADQLTRINELLSELADQHPDTDWRGKAREFAGCPADRLTGVIAAMLIHRLEQETDTAAA